MEQRISMITLGVSDLERSRNFYEKGLGWKASRDGGGSICFFQVGGSVFSLYPRAALAEDVQIPVEGTGFGGVTLAYNARNSDEVDATLKQAEVAGARILKQAQDVFWGGYSGYFADPDGFLWEVAWNPHWELDKDGNVQLPA